MQRLTPESAEAFILANTALKTPPHVPEIKLRLADEMYAIWLKTEEELAEMGLPPPFWAFAWAGGQGLARHILDNPEIVRGRQVLDFATGSGLVGIAAAKAGAASVRAADADLFCHVAVALNSAANAVDIEFMLEDVLDTDHGWDIVFAGDVFYDPVFAKRLVPWFEALHARGATVLVGDPGRHYMPTQGFDEVAVYQVPVVGGLEDSNVKRTTVWRFVGQ